MAMVFCALAAGCGDDDSSSDETRSTEQATPSSASPGATGEGTTDEVALDPDATIRIISTAPPPGSWDPATTLSPNQDIQFYSYVYDSLLGVNADNEIEPRLATDWEYDETGTRVTLTLRDDVTFTDGSPFNADVAKLNLDRVRTGTGGAARLLGGIASIEVVSPTELVIVQNEASVKVLLALATTAASMASPLAIENPEALAQNPVGTGPYLLDSTDSTTATFVRNDDYWNGDDVVYAARHVVTGAVDGNARINAALSGSADLARITMTALTPDVFEAVEDGTLAMVNILGQASSIGVNNNVPPLDNPKVVQAINHAIDREAYNEVIYGGQCAPTSQIFVDGMLGHVDGLEYEFDLDKARQLMDEAGVGDDVTVSYQGVAGAPTAGVELLQSMLSEIGITLEVTQSPVQEVFPNFFSGRFAMSALALFLTVPDPSNITDYVSGPLNPGTKSPELIDMVTEANALSPDDPGRAEAYEDINRYVFENPVMVPLCQNPNVLLSVPELVGADSIPFSSIGASDFTRLGMRAE